MYDRFELVLEPVTSWSWEVESGDFYLEIDYYDDNIFNLYKRDESIGSFSSVFEAQKYLYDNFAGITQMVE